MRLRTDGKDDVVFRDLIKGDMRVPSGAFGDFVLLRSDGWPSYNLAVVVDDADMGVNLVLRGEDHLTNTARQLLLYEALGLTAPSFAHHGLLVDTDGKKLSKRTGALSVTDCIREGLEPMAVVHYLAALSGALPLKNLFASLEDMARAFNPFALGRGNAVMNMEELRSLSARYFRAADPQMQVAALDQAVATGDTWHSLDNAQRLDLVTGLRDNAQSIHELQNMLPHFTADRVRYDEEALQGLASGANVLEALFAELANIEPETSLAAQQAKDILKRTAQQSDAKGRALYHPIRLALTGSDAGPELSALLTLLSADTLRTRIRSALNILPPSKNKD